MGDDWKCQPNRRETGTCRCHVGRCAKPGLHTINALEKQYAAEHGNIGFTCELPLLRRTDKRGETHDPVAALLIGEWSGYRFAVVDCAGELNGIVTHCKATAVPVTPAGTGIRAFCTDESGKLFYDLDASPSQCLDSRRVVPGSIYRTIEVLVRDLPGYATQYKRAPRLE